MWQHLVTVTSGINSFYFLPTVQYSTLVSQRTEAGGHVEEVPTPFCLYIATLRKLQNSTSVFISALQHEIIG
jgi:hypothetical protein